MTAPAPSAAPEQRRAPQAVPPVYRPLPRAVPPVLVVGALVVALLVRAVVGTGTFLTALVAVLVFAVALNVASRSTEGARRATDRTVTTVVTGAFLLAVVPLVSLLYTVLANGLERLDVDFFQMSMRNIVGEGGGGVHAVYGTLWVTGIATAISVPIGLLCAIYLVEYGRGRLARSVTFLVDVMTGIPSIVAGLFAYALFVVFFGPGVRFGIGGAVALSVLMIPVVVRAGEEMLKLVPAELREAAYALGVPKWKTIVKVVLPVAAAGIGTGVTLAVARIIGETAPLLLIAGVATSINNNPLEGRMMTLPVFAFQSFRQPGADPQPSLDRAWTAALVLMIIVLLLNAVARLVAKAFAPKGSR